jgi:hypothetical protein
MIELQKIYHSEINVSNRKATPAIDFQSLLIWLPCALEPSLDPLLVRRARLFDRRCSAGGELLWNLLSNPICISRDAFRNVSRNWPP